jgi:hypothetical protein
MRQIKRSILKAEGFPPLFFIQKRMLGLFVPVPFGCLHGRLCAGNRLKPFLADFKRVTPMPTVRRIAFPLESKDFLVLRRISSVIIGRRALFFGNVTRNSSF